MSVRSVIVDAYRSALPTLVVSAAGGLLAGAILSGMDDQFETIPGLLVMVPAFLAIRGSVYGSMGARLSSALHQGLVEPVFEPDDRVVAAVAAALLNGLIASLFAAVLTYGMLSVLGRAVAPLWTLAFVAVVGAAIAGVALSAVVLVAVFLGYRRGINPDDLVGPVTTTAGDVFGTLSLLIAAELAVHP